MDEGQHHHHGSQHDHGNQQNHGGLPQLHPGHPGREVQPGQMRHGGSALQVEGRQLTRLAVTATLHCLTGCAIGEVLGMVLATWWGWGDAASIVLAVALAFFFGYLLTVGPVLRAGLPLRQAVRVALAADTVSIVVMEIVDNGVMLAVPGALEAHLNTWMFWGSLAFALAVAFAVTVPVNRALIATGKGHAAAHAHH